MSVHQPFATRQPLAVRLLPWWLRCLGWALSSEFPSLRMFYLWSRVAGHGRRASLVQGWRLFVTFAKRR